MSLQYFGFPYGIFQHVEYFLGLRKGSVCYCQGYMRTARVNYHYFSGFISGTGVKTKPLTSLITFHIYFAALYRITYLKLQLGHVTLKRVIDSKGIFEKLVLLSFYLSVLNSHFIQGCIMSS